MQFNYKGVIGFFIVGLAMIVLLALIVPGAHAEQTNGSYIVTDYLNAAPLNYIPRIEQGDDVYVNDTIDITGVSGWSGADGEYRIAWYGQYIDVYSPEDIDPKFVLQLPGKTRLPGSESQYRFYLDPDVFSTRTGYWYQFISNSSRLNGHEGAGNLRVFRVKSNYRTVTEAGVNDTRFVYQPQQYEEKTIVEPLLPEKHITGYLVARGDNLTLNYDGVRIWVFGRVQGIYDNRVGGLSAEDISSLEVGNYKLVTQYAGPNTIYEVSYSHDGKLVPGLYGRDPVSVYGMAAPVVHQKFKEMLVGTDDRISEFNMEVQDPAITIERADEVWANGAPCLDIRGYTNVANGTLITLTLDEGQTYFKNIRANTAYGNAVRTFPGNMSYWKVVLPLNYDELRATADMHTLRASTAIGGYVVHDFKVSTLPADSYRPNATVKYIEDRNPFVPTPAPEIIIKELPVPGPVQVVMVKERITPDTSDYGRVVEGIWWILVISAVWVISGIVIVVGGGYAVLVWWRGRKE